ncbi:hypothetical protein BDQ12DRAFT_601842 [Crucibulum laeve]|uniref:RGS domain-containing protein n=1 Tax=Crucibulum laeve TaxID=68775 RepID=A0A5C3M5E8_9AGAR|nr:hypothetical protein BDQ12DRAFT_601842 [Crucibulum laeve]
MQPRTYSLTFKSILSLPFRICNPPPAVGKVRSCGVTPLFQVRLEDVLNRQHLPPLGLKDFEEWLLYVELCPENLYFILWLREYQTRYAQWEAQAKFQRDSGEFRYNWSSQNSSPLAMFYARAKQTFLVPNAAYELNLSSDLLAPFHVLNESPHPDPIIFTEVANEIQRMLEDSLRRFVTAQYNNVGNNRVLCGIIAGTIFCIAGTIAPTTVSFTRGYSRWARLAAFPGLWLGLMIILAAFHGVCLGVYIFGDLRQLRRFELSRPPISKPKPLPGLRHTRPTVPPITIPPINPMSQALRPSRLTILPPPPSLTQVTHSHPNTSSACSDASSTFSESSIDIEAAIHISPEYYDADAIEGPATSPIMPDTYTYPEKTRENDSSASFPCTAGFIHPFNPLVDDDYDIEQVKPATETRQTISPFDFDSLPVRITRPKAARRPKVASPVEKTSCDGSFPSFPQPTLSPLTRFIARFQGQCNIEKWRMQPGRLEPSRSHTPSSSVGTPLPSPKVLQHNPRVIVSEEKVRKRFRMVKAVPAFAVPLTRVLNPIIVRGQWEIVVRSAAAAFVITWVIVGALLAIPEAR